MNIKDRTFYIYHKFNFLGEKVKKLLLILSIALVHYLNINAQPHSISYELTIPDCANSPNTLIFGTGHFLEGESFTFPSFTLPTQYSVYQQYYDAFVGAEFGVPVGSLNEDIKFVINLNDICLNGLIDNPDTKEIIELLFLNVSIVGSVSGDHNPLEYYYFNDDKEAYIKLVLANIAPLSGLLGFDIDQLIPFFTANSLNPDFTGIRKVEDATHYTIYLRHFSEIRVGAATSPTSVDSRIPGLPAEYALNQNFPNPFNPGTVITYAIPTASNVKIEIFNLTGEKIATLVDGFKDKGNYQVSFSANNLPSGMYLYRINAGAFISTKKMILMK